MENSVSEYELVYNAFSFTIAVMGAAAIFFSLSRSHVARRTDRPSPSPTLSRSSLASTTCASSAVGKPTSRLSTERSSPTV